MAWDDEMGAGQYGWLFADSQAPDDPFSRENHRSLGGSGAMAPRRTGRDFSKGTLPVASSLFAGLPSGAELSGTPLANDAI